MAAGRGHEEAAGEGGGGPGYLVTVPILSHCLLSAWLVGHVAMLQF